jgi:hypothetical protein
MVVRTPLIATKSCRCHKKAWQKGQKLVVYSRAKLESLEEAWNAWKMNGALLHRAPPAPFIVCRGSGGTYRGCRRSVEVTWALGDLLGRRPTLDSTVLLHHRALISSQRRLLRQHMGRFGWEGGG